MKKFYFVDLTERFKIIKIILATLFLISWIDCCSLDIGILGLIVTILIWSFFFCLTFFVEKKLKNGPVLSFSSTHLNIYNKKYKYSEIQHCWIKYIGGRALVFEVKNKKLPICIGIENCLYGTMISEKDEKEILKELDKHNVIFQYKIF